MVKFSDALQAQAVAPNTNRIKFSDAEELHSLKGSDPIQTNTSNLQRERKRGVLDNVKYFLGEGILKPIARGIETIPAGVEAVVQRGFDNVRNIASKQLKEDGAVFGITDEQFAARTPEQKRRIALNNRIVENMDKSIETSKRLQQNWIEATQTGVEAPSEEFLKSSPIPFTEDFSMTRMFALGAQSVPMLGLAATVTAATKSPIAGAAILGVIEAAEEAGIAREKGLTVEESNLIFIGNAVVLSALETVPLTSFMKGGTLPVRMFRTGTQEGFEEVLQGLWRDSVAKIGYDETRNLTEGLLEEFLGGFISGNTIGAFGPSRNTRQRITTAKNKGVDTDKMTEVVAEQVIEKAEDISESFLAKASPESIEVEGVEPVEPTKEELPITTEEIDLLKFSEKAFPELNKQLKESIEKKEIIKIRENQDSIIKETVDSVSDILAEQKTPEKQLPLLNELLDENFSTIEEAKSFVSEIRKSRKEIRKDIKRAKPKTIKTVQREETALKEKLRTLRTGFRKGKTVTTQDIQEVQDSAIKLLKRSDLGANDRAKFQDFIKKLTKDNFEKQQPILEKRIADLEESAIKRELIGKFKDLTKKKNIKKIRPEFKGPIQGIIDDLSVSIPSEKKVQNLNKLAKFIESEPGNQIPESRIAELRALTNKPLRAMTSDEIQTIVDSVSHLIHLNELKNKIILKGKLKDFDELRNESITNLAKQNEKRDLSIDGMDSFQQENEAKLWKKIFGTDSYNAELKTEILDGEVNGVIKEAVYNGIDRGVDEQLRFQQEAEDFFIDKFKGIDIRKWSAVFQQKKGNIEQVTIKISNDRTLKMIKGERVAIYLHSLNNRNREHLITGGFSFSNTPAKIVKLSNKDLNIITESLTPNEFKVADVISEYLNTVQKDAINEVSVDIDGFEIATEENYFRIRTNFLDRKRDELLKATKNFSRRTLEGLGIFKERQDAKNAIILEDAFLATYESIFQVSAYVGLAQPLRTAKALVNDNAFQIKIREIGRGDYIASLRNYLERVENDSTKLDNVDRLTQEAINRLDVALLGLNPYVVLKQPVSYIGASTEIDGKYLRGSFKAKASESELSEIKKYSPQLYDRTKGNVSRELGEIAQVGRPKRFFTGEEVISQKYMQGIVKGDTAAISSIWRSVKKEISDKNPNLTGDEYFEKVAERAWEVTRKTQPTFHIKDRSTIGMSRNTFIRLGTKYSSQRNKNWMMIRRAIEEYNRSHKTPKDKATVVGKLMIVNFLAPLLITAIDILRETMFGKEDKKNLFVRFAVGLVSNTIGNIYFLGTGFRSLVSKIEKGTFSGYDINDPVASTLDDIVNVTVEGVKSVVTGITGEKYQRGRLDGEAKWEESLKKFVNGSIDLTGKIKGVNLSIIRRFLARGIELISGNKNKSKNRSF